MFSFKTMVCFAFFAMSAVAIRAATDSFIPPDEDGQHGDCWHAFSAPGNFDTLTAVVTQNLGEQCRSEVRRLLQNLFTECTKMEASEQKCRNSSSSG